MNILRSSSGKVFPVAGAAGACIWNKYQTDAGKTSSVAQSITSSMISHCAPAEKPSIPTGFVFKPTGSVFDLSQKELEFYTKRLLPGEETPQSIWGCSSLTGFLAPGENLLKCCEKDRKILEERKVSYQTVATRIDTVWKTALKEGQDKLVEGKFKVEIKGPTICRQFCPFSPVSDEDASPFAPVKGACGSTNLDITITNTKTGRSIQVNPLLIHMIEKHGFFEGSVPHRASPADIIDTLELKPDPGFSLSIPAPSSSEIEPSAGATSSWKLAGIYPISKLSSSELESALNELASFYGCEVLDFNGIKGLLLPYYDSFSDFDPKCIKPNGPWFHLVNPGDKSKRLSGTCRGVILPGIDIPVGKRIILALE